MLDCKEVNGGHLFSLCRIKNSDYSVSQIGFRHFCCCADQSQRNRALSSIKWGWLVACLMDWDFVYLFNTVYASKNCYILSWYVFFLFVCLLLVFCKLLEPSNHFTMNFDSNVCGSFICPRLITNNTTLYCTVCTLTWEMDSVTQRPEMLIRPHLMTLETSQWMP